MSAVLYVPRPGLPAEARSDCGTISRARKVVATLGGRFSLELGIEVDAGADEIERWALAATLLCSKVSTTVAMRTFRVLEQAGVETLLAAGDHSHEDLLVLLESGGYAGYCERTASRLHVLARAVAHRHGGRIALVADKVEAPYELELTLAALPGWGPATVRTFLRELRGVWPGATPRMAEGSARAAEHAHLPATLDGLGALADAAHLDVRDLEVSLVRLALAHDFAPCPGGEECPFASLDPDDCVHF